MNAEEGASIRAVRRAYAEKAGMAFEQAPEPKVIFDIGQGKQPGNKEAAVGSVPPAGRGRSATPWASADAGGRPGGDRRRHVRRVAACSCRRWWMS